MLLQPLPSMLLGSYLNLPDVNRGVLMKQLNSFEVEPSEHFILSDISRVLRPDADDPSHARWLYLKSLDVTWWSDTFTITRCLQDLIAKYPVILFDMISYGHAISTLVDFYSHVTKHRLSKLPVDQDSELATSINALSDEDVEMLASSKQGLFVMCVLNKNRCSHEIIRELESSKIMREFNSPATIKVMALSVRECYGPLFAGTLFHLSVVEDVEMLKVLLGVKELNIAGLTSKVSPSHATLVKIAQGEAVTKREIAFVCEMLFAKDSLPQFLHYMATHHPDSLRDLVIPLHYWGAFALQYPQSITKDMLPADIDDIYDLVPEYEMTFKQLYPLLRMVTKFYEHDYLLKKIQLTTEYSQDFKDLLSGLLKEWKQKSTQ